MKKILYIVTREIYPMVGGREVVLYNYCKGLYEGYECSVDLFCFGNTYKSTIDQENLYFINKVYYVKGPNILKKAFNILKTPITKNPLQVSLYYDRKQKQYLKKIINKNKYDIAICDMARTAEYLKDIEGIKKVLDMNDIISNRYYRQYNSINKYSNILGQFSNKIPRPLKKIVENEYIAKFIIKKEANLLKKYEINIGKYFDYIIFVSYLETSQYNKLIGDNKAITIPIGVNYNYYSKQLVNKSKVPMIIFLGNMDISHNRDAVNNFIENIFPKLIQEIPNLIFRIVGKCNESYKKEMEKNKNVQVTGMVDDLRKYIQEGWLSVAPLTYGSGVKTKILETMAMGLPVVTNKIGGEGISANCNDGLFIEDNNNNITNRILELINDKEKIKNLSNKSKKLVKEKYTWEKVLINFNYIINENKENIF